MRTYIEDMAEYFLRWHLIALTFLKLDLEQHVEPMHDHRLNSDARLVNNVDKMVDDKQDNCMDLLCEYFPPEEQNYN